jgi:hypothetical protein
MTGTQNGIIPSGQDRRGEAVIVEWRLSFSVLFLVTASRMRSHAGDTIARL